MSFMGTTHSEPAVTPDDHDELRHEYVTLIAYDLDDWPEEWEAFDWSELWSHD
jgi:hypothetical protein